MIIDIQHSAQERQLWAQQRCSAQELLPFLEAANVSLLPSLRGRDWYLTIAAQAAVLTGFGELSVALNPHKPYPDGFSLQPLAPTHLLNYLDDLRRSFELAPGSFHAWVFPWICFEFTEWGASGVHHPELVHRRQSGWQLGMLGREYTQDVISDPARGVSEARFPVCLPTKIATEVPRQELARVAIG